MNTKSFNDLNYIQPLSAQDELSYANAVVMEAAETEQFIWERVPEMKQSTNEEAALVSIEHDKQVLPASLCPVNLRPRS